MMRAAVEGAVDGSQLAGSDADARCGILGVTVLTSHTAETQALAWGRPAVDVQGEVQRLAGDTVKAGAAGIVCSGHEAAPVRALFGDRLGLLIPGIRLEGGSTHDQQRVMTPRDAGVAGANWIILGRAVTGADDPRLAMTLVHEQLSSL